MRLLVLLAVSLLVACSTTSVAQQKRIPITVVGTGTSLKQAKDDAFKIAVQQEIGVVLLSHTEVKRNKLTLDEIITHSSGYVDEFKILNTDVQNGTYYVTMNVWVTSNKIAERVLSVSKVENDINGEKLSTQYETFLKSRDDGNRVLATVLNDYPINAFNVSNPKIDCNGKEVYWCFKLDKKSNAVIVIPWELRWNYKYLKALDESLAILSDKKSGSQRVVVSLKDPKQWIGETNQYYFNDDYRVNNIKQSLSPSSGIHVIANIIDDNGVVLYKQCSQALMQGAYDDNYSGSSTYWVKGNIVLSDEIKITIPRLNPAFDKLSKASKIKLTIGTGC